MSEPTIRTEDNGRGDYELWITMDVLTPSIMMRICISYISWT
ncbi:hypothetical protein [Paenibacillus agaridevorans]|nr:hypothetical protein [Paenibacillus agaridevorans]